MYVLLEMWIGIPVACMLTVEWSICWCRYYLQSPDQAEMKRNAKKATEKDGAKAPPARQSPRKRPCTDKKGEVREEEDRHVWLDSDAKSLDCGICFMPFEAEVFMASALKLLKYSYYSTTSASFFVRIYFDIFFIYVLSYRVVFQCINGHAACAECCVRINKKCWCCGEAIGRVRCRPVENMLAEMNTLCKFSNYGCAEIIKFVQKRAHEESCRHAPYGCPVDGCSYRGMNMGLYAGAGALPVPGLPRPAPGRERRRQVQDGGARLRWRRRALAAGDGVVHPRARGLRGQQVPLRAGCVLGAFR